jgi:divalent metal cation (Fe/Co/Zn/Cd) transporter
MQPVIPDAIAAALPVIGEIVVRALADDRQKTWVNALIAGAFLVLVAIVCCWLAGNFTGDLTTSIGIVIAYCALLMRGSLGMLLQFFDLAGSPVANALFGHPPVVKPAASRPESSLSEESTAPMAAVKPTGSADLPK